MIQRRTQAAFRLALAACLLLAACGERAPAVAPGPAIPGEGPALVAPAPPSAPIPDPQSSAPGSAAATLSLSANDPRIGSLVGTHSPELGLVADGRAGWMLFGPYAHLDAGHYQVAIRGAVQAGHVGPVHFDIASAKGSKVIAERDVDPAAPVAGGDLEQLDFDLPSAVDDIEVRVRVGEQTRISVSGYDIRPRP